jgi:hypothetical protein
VPKSIREADDVCRAEAVGVNHDAASDAANVRMVRVHAAVNHGYANAATGEWRK